MRPVLVRCGPPCPPESLPAGLRDPGDEPTRAPDNPQQATTGHKAAAAHLWWVVLVSAHCVCALWAAMATRVARRRAAGSLRRADTSARQHTHPHQATQPPPSGVRLLCGSSLLVPSGLQCPPEQLASALVRPVDERRRASAGEHAPATPPPHTPPPLLHDRMLCERPQCVPSGPPCSPVVPASPLRQAVAPRSSVAAHEGAHPHTGWRACSTGLCRWGTGWGADRGRGAAGDPAGGAGRRATGAGPGKGR
jgi:hypothetical protein